MQLDALLLMLETNRKEAERELAERDHKGVTRETLRV